MKIIDLCAGVGGVRLGFDKAFGGVECLLTSEIDKFAQQTYIENWGNENLQGDLFQIKETEVPDHDILLAGFPCQAFSKAGLKLGFDDVRGTVFFEILRIIRAKKPRVLFFENVPELLTHDKGKTFKTIYGLLEAEGYNVFYQRLNTKDFGLPQRRERVFIVCFLDDVFFSFPVPPRTPTRVGDILEDADDSFTLSDNAWKGFRERKERNKANGKGFGYQAVTSDSTHTGTITANYYKDGVQCLVLQEGKNPRRLTPRECFRLQGFPDSFIINKSKMQAYKQAGNSVSIPVIEAIAKQIKKVLCHTTD
ncbi:MAG: DNA-cytosine methyltransferase [Enterobacter phage ENC19]|nr:MAG: DNA-cytosine methyltransferase [Enterobacter phage ENC19]